MNQNPPSAAPTQPKVATGNDDKHFEQLVKSGSPVGEVISIDRFLIKVKGLHPVNVHALVIFDNGNKGFVHQILPDYALILYLGKNLPTVGDLVVVQRLEFDCKVGKDYVGRVINAAGDPLDGKGQS